MRKKSKANGKAIGNLNTSTLNVNVDVDSFTARVLIGIPATGSVRIEWVQGRYGQLVPTNWSHVEVMQFFSSYIPVKYQVADAENIIAKQVVEGNFEWFFSIEHDNVLPPNTFLKMNQYMIEKKYPVVSGLYFTKSVPPEPILYRGIGTGYYNNWKLGDLVWVDGVPFGCTLIHGNLIRAAWKESPEYTVNGQIVRRVFEGPSRGWSDPEFPGVLMNEMGTTDLAFWKRCKRDRLFEKAGWPEYQKMQYPLLVDTSIFCKHITPDGVQYPLEIPAKFVPNNAKITTTPEGARVVTFEANQIAVESRPLQKS